MVNIGDHSPCPQCNKMGHVVWISKKGNVFGVQCSASHAIERLPDSQGFYHRQSKANKNCVFLVRI
jgi:hypothetical protein